MVVFAVAMAPVRPSAENWTSLRETDGGRGESTVVLIVA